MSNISGSAARVTHGGQAATRAVPVRSFFELSAGAWVVPVTLVALTLAVFSPSLSHDFVEWDDNVNIIHNPAFRGLGWWNLKWMFTTTLMGHYIPVTWLTFGIDYLVWGMNPAGYHLTNLLLHAANVLLFFHIARRLLAKATAWPAGTQLLAAAVAALAFGLHPLRVESVTWVTERRDVLSGLFFFFTVLGYLRASEAEGRRRWGLLALSVGAYLLALGSKSIAMTLPLVLLLLDLYPLRRLSLAPGPERWRRMRPVLLEKLPFAVLGAIGAAVGYYAVKSQQFFTPLDMYAWSARPVMATYSAWFYVSKTAFPLELSPLYQLPSVVDPLAPRFLMPAIAVALVSAAVVALRRRWPAGLAVWAYYLIVLGPVSGLVHAGHQLAHDRYSYLSCLGFALLLGAGVGVLARAWAQGRISPAVARIAAAGTLAWFVGLAALTWSQTHIWRDTDTLWRWAVQLDEQCSVCLGNLGATLSKQGHLGLARDYYEHALAVRPDRPVHPHLGLAALAMALGAFEEAGGHFTTILASRPDDIRALNGLAAALLRQGHPDRALPHLEHALAVKPDDPEVRTTLGVVLADLGRSDEAIKEFRQAIERAPHLLGPRLWLARTYLALDDVHAARREFTHLARLSPAVAEQLRPAFMTN